MNPGFVLGPTLTDTPNISVDIIAKIMNQNMPALVDVMSPCVDVRDVAQAHLLALRHSNSNGRRYMLVEGSYTFEEQVNFLRQEFEPQGWRLVRRKVGYCLTKFFSFFDSDIKGVLNYIGKRITFDNSRSVKELGLVYTPFKKTLVDMGYNLLKKKMVIDRRKKLS